MLHMYMSLVLFAGDQASKIWVVANFDLYESKALLPLLNVTYVHNTGAAFSFLSSAGGSAGFLWVLR